MQKFTYNSVFLCDITVSEYTLATLLGTPKQSNETQHSSTDIWLFLPALREVLNHICSSLELQDSRDCHMATESRKIHLPRLQTMTLKRFRPISVLSGTTGC